MCYKINEHHLTHDVRPCVSYSGLQKSIQLVNPYSMPQPCCEQSAAIASWFACSYGHGCCYATSRIAKCTAAQDHEPHCDTLTPYHTYQEREPLVEGKKWPCLSVLDEDIGSTEDGHNPFPPHHQVVFEMGSDVEDLGEGLEQLIAEFFAAKATYHALQSGWRCDAHKVCERVLQPHECREFSLREELRMIQDRLEAMESEIIALEVKFSVRRLRFDATAFGYAGKCDISNLSIKL